MNDFSCHRFDTSPLLTRRSALARLGLGLGGFGLAALLQRDGLLAAGAATARGPHFPATAKNIILIYLGGGPSQIELFDPKLELRKLHGQVAPEYVRKLIPSAGTERKILGSPLEFRRYGQCGMELSALLPHLGGMADELLLVRSMTSPVNDHEPGNWMFHTARRQGGFPSIGAWAIYGLGSGNANLPAYVALPSDASGPQEKINRRAWGSAWLPSENQGTEFLMHQKTPLFDLERPAGITAAQDTAALDLLGGLNRKHLAQHPGNAELEGRIRNYELMGRMQLATAEVTNLAKESAATRTAYGLDEAKTKDWGTRCLVARRLVESGVRFVHLLSSEVQWDHHSGLKKNLETHTALVDRPSARSSPTSSSAASCATRSWSSPAKWAARPRASPTAVWMAATTTTLASPSS